MQIENSSGNLSKLSKEQAGIEVKQFINRVRSVLNHLDRLIEVPTYLGNKTIGFAKIPLSCKYEASSLSDKEDASSLVYYTLVKLLIIFIQNIN